MCHVIMGKEMGRIDANRQVLKVGGKLLWETGEALTNQVIFWRDFDGLGDTFHKFLRASWKSA